MSGLPHVTVQILRAAAILGATFDVADLVMTMGRTALDLSSILSEPLRARILEGANDKLRFRHDLYQRRHLRGAALGLRRALHGEAARPDLTDLQAPPTRLVTASFGRYRWDRPRG